MSDVRGIAAGRAPRVTVVDYGAGNLVSIDQALRAVGADVTVAERPAEIGEPALLLVPGVGAAEPAMARLRHAGFDDAIRSWATGGRPYLGICLGLQLLFERSDEDGSETLGLLPGRTIRIPGAPRLPHIGWNQVALRRPHLLFEGVDADADVYFVHSYAGAPRGAAGEAAVLGETVHGSRFVSAVAADNLLGVQFHPERSGDVGLRLLANAVRWAVAA